MKFFNFAFISTLLSLCLLFIFNSSQAQLTSYNNNYDYLNVNRTAFVTVPGLNDTQTHYFTILKHSFEVQKIVSYPTDTSFTWNGLKGKKTIYSNDSLILFFLRPNDGIKRPCIFLTHGNNEQYRGSWHEKMKFNAIDLAMRGYCVAYYENPTSYESKNKYITNSTRKAFYNGFQAAVAANMYVVKNAANLQVDTSLLFAGGLSFGAFCSLTLATADSALNFTDTLFKVQGSFTKKSIYNLKYSKNIKRVFSIGGGFPKDDTVAINNSYMGNFLDSSDNNIAILFLHGYYDNLVQLNTTKFGTADTVGSFFYAEGPQAIVNNIKKYHLKMNAKTVLNCKGGHPFITTVCDSTDYNCIQQYQWLYLTEPPNNVTTSDPYFTDNLKDTLLHYFVYMSSQISDVDFMISDFLQPSVNHTASQLSKELYYVQPRNYYSYNHAEGYYIFKDLDCDGNEILTAMKDVKLLSDEVKIYPNPAQFQLHFQSKETIETIRIYNLFGELLLEKYVNNNIEQLNIQSFPVGEYIATIQFKKSISTKKILVIH